MLPGGFSRKLSVRVSMQNGLTGMERHQACCMRTRSPSKATSFIALLFVLFTGSCALLQEIPLKPGFELERVEFVGFTLEAVALKLHTKISNPYPVSMPRAQLTLKLKVEGVDLADLSAEQKGIEARSVSALVFDVSIPYSALRGVYARFPGKEQLALELNGKLDIAVPEAARITESVPKTLAFAFQSKRNIPAVLPSLSIRNFRIIKPTAEEIKAKVVAAVKKDPEQAVRKAASFLDSLLNKGGPSPGSAVEAGLQEVDIEIRTEFEIVLENKAAAQLDFRTLQYEFHMNDQRFLTGKSADIKTNGGTSIVKIETVFSLRSVSTGLADAIKARRVRYRLNGSAGVRIPAVTTEAVSYEFDRSGDHTW